MTGKRSMIFFILLAFMLVLSGCAADPSATPVERTEPVTGNQDPSALFLETDQTVAVETAPHISRSRFVHLNLSLLLTDQGEPLPLEPGTKLTLNLFPDLTYIGVLGSVLQDEGGTSWVGTLEGIEYSEMTMVYTGEAFIAHIASPLGVYEVSSLGDGLYRVIQIDQNQLPGGEG